jgi:hypothetical protein
MHSVLWDFIILISGFFWFSYLNYIIQLLYSLFGFDHESFVNFYDNIVYHHLIKIAMAADSLYCQLYNISSLN